MRGREKVGWNVPAEVYDTHRTWAENEGYKSHARAVEDAMRAYIDADDLAEIEDRLNDILATPPSNDGAKKTDPDPPGGHVVSGPTREVGQRIDTDLKATFARHVREEFDTRPGVALGYALQEHHDTGSRNRRQRIHDTIDGIEATVEGMEATGQHKVSAIADQLGETFRLSEFVEAAEAVGVTTRKYAIENYLLDILDWTETVPYPNNPRRFIPKTAVDAPENPNPANLPYYAMNDEEMRVAIQVAGVRKAWSNGGRARFPVEEGVDILSGEGSPRHKTVRSAMREAATFDGFRFDNGDNPGLLVNADALDTLGLNTVLAIAREEKRGERDDEETTTDKTNDGANPEGSDDDIAEEMDALMNATPATDGGRENS